VVEVLRLMVLLGIANNGIPRRHFDALRSHLLQTYGHHHLPLLNSLEKCGGCPALPWTMRGGCRAAASGCDLRL
jgi:hypothetical protein